MANLGGQRAQFTWALNQYNVAEDAATRTLNVKRMAKVVTDAPANGFTVEEVTQGQPYPEAEVSKHLNDPGLSEDPGLTEGQAIQAVQQAIDTSEVQRVGDGKGVVYAYGYRCAPDRLKVGYTDGDAVQRIAAQINTSTPDRPTLFLEIKIDNSRALERAIQTTLEVRGCKVEGGGTEWFKTTREEIIEIYSFIKGTAPKAELTS